MDFLHYWEPKGDLCYILQNEKEITRKHGKEFFETISFKHEKGIGICDKCEYKMPCQWDLQKDTAMGYDILLMNKDNIKTPLIKDSHFYTYLKLFYKYDIYEDVETPRTIIYDEKLEKLHIEKFNELEDSEIDLLNKILKLIDPSINTILDDDWDIAEKIDFIDAVLENKPTNSKILKDINFNFNVFGKLDPEIYLKILFNKLRINKEIHDYLEDKPPLPFKNKKVDLDFFTYEKLYIDILFERKDKHKIILLDATPLKTIVDTIKDMEGFKEIELDLDIFNKESSLLRICRNGKPVNTSRSLITDRVKEDNIKDIFNDKAYTPVIETNQYIKEFKQSKDIKFGVVSYQFLDLDYQGGPVYILDELKEKIGDVHTLYFGNTRGRSELNKCDILHIVGTDRHPPPSQYNLYRYLGGNKSYYDLKKKKGYTKLTFNDKLFNEILDHQIESEMEQVIFRNMPHMNKRLTILEGYFPEHLRGYFKKVAKINLHEYSQKNLFPKVIKHFLKATYLGKPFDFEEVNKLCDISFKSEKKAENIIKKNQEKEYQEKVLKLAKKYMSKRYQNKYGCKLKGIFHYLNRKYGSWMKYAELESLSKFRRLYKKKYKK